MFAAVQSPYLVTFDGTFKLKSAPTAPPKKAPDKDARKAHLAELVEELSALQHILYAHSSYSVLLVFQAMDAAGKEQHDSRRSLGR